MVTNSGKNKKKSKQSRPVQDKATNEEDQMETVELSRIPPEKLNYLNMNHIFLELHKSKRKYELVCNACGISMTTVGAAIHHTSMNYHNVNVTTVELKHTLFYLPPITESHRVALDASLKSSTASVIADRNEIQRRQNFANDLIAAIEARIPNIRVRGTGSVWFNLALPDMEVSLDAVRVDDADECSSPTKESVIDYENAGPLSPRSDSSQLTEEEKRAKANSLGLGYVLSHIFELLQCNACEQPTSKFEDTTMSEKNIHNSISSSDKTEANELSEEPKFPKFHTVLRTNTDTFYLSLTDLHGVAYHIGTGHPHGYDLAKLIDTYLKLNDKALQLSILFRKLARLAHLDMPENGTFAEPIIPMLVIFYLQHCDPSILPNLHNLYRQHMGNIPQDSYHQVLLPDGDLSFITDIELIRSLCPDKPFTDSSSSCELPSLADLWLGFLRFYLFDFKMSSCAIDIMRSQPVSKSSGAKRYFTVIDPFNRTRNLCSNVTAVSLDYINSQLLAAYGYFGVPRLARNGRHVFTKISVAKEINVKEDDKSDGGDDDKNKDQEGTQTNIEQNENTTNTTANSAKTTPQKGTKVKIVHITPIFDDSDGFAKNLNKVTNLISEKFHSLSIARNNSDAFQSLGSEDLVNSLNDQNNKPKTLPLSQMLPHLLYCVMDELFESVDVPGLVEACSNLPQYKFFSPLTGSDEMTLSDFNWIARNYAYRFWLKHFKVYISQAIYTVQKRRVVRCATFQFRMSIKSWLSTLKPSENAVNSTNDDANIQEGNGAALQKTEESNGKKSERSSYSPLTVQTKDDQISTSQIINKKNIVTNKISQENDNKRIEDGGEKEEEEEKEGKENSSKSDNFNSPNSCTFSDEDDEEVDGTDEVDKLSSLEVNDDDGDEFVTTDEKVFADDNCFINHDEMNEELERTLELGDDDELNESAIDPHITTLSSFINKSSDGIDCSIVHESHTTGNDETEPDNINLTSENSKQAGDSNLCSTPNKSVTAASDKIAEDTSTVMAPPSKLSRKERKKGKEEDISTTANTDMKENNSVKAKKSKVLQWNDVILSRIAVSQPVDDERPDYYNSELLKDLQPEDFDFTFAARSHFPSRGHRTQTSVLGLASRNHPSTLLAHFDAPQPQCQACGVTGHRWTQCQTSNDKSVSFLAWRKLSNKTTWPPKSEQIKDLTSCLERLEKYHEADEKIHARKEFVQKIQQVFASRFPSVQLELFGSCANGFDLQSSDLDVCVFFPTKSPEWLAMQDEKTTVEMIKKFRNQLFRSSNRLQLVQVQPVLKARVPILKVSFRNSFEVDISFSNYLALSNTRMLAFYSELQPKLRILGIALKTVTKITKIGKAAAGGISSYACIIMIIHYLQQIGQLPVLQELYEGQSKPVTIVNGWDVWYQNDLSVINRLWKPTNPDQPVGELWLGFLRYYLFEFDHDAYVVTIRQKKLLIRFVKMWKSLFAIEDPFNLNHNLTSGLSHSMLLYLLNVFHTVLVHHTTFLRKQMSMGQWC
ncbi:unnamed protein product [Trichobilharzia szidati]|nr:unnamed protein product [Trichobilharzia szidati]